MSNYFDDDDAFWDGTGFDPDRTSQIERVRGRSVDRTRTHRVVRREEPLDQLDDGSSMWLEPSSRIADRLGPLGTVDPRVLSIGAVALAVVLAVPLFGALGDGGNGDELRAINEQSTTTVTTVATPTTSADAVVVTAAVDPEISGETDVEVDGGDSDAADSVADEEAAHEEDAPSAPQALSAAPDCTNQYTAAAGDYWLRIADGTGTSLDALLDVNEASPDTPIYPGSTICLPAGASAPAGFAASSSGESSGGAASRATMAAACANPYESAAGDYWLRIADAAGLELDELLELNNATSDTPLFPGSEVCLPAGAAGPAAPTTTPPTTQPATTAAQMTEPPTTDAPASTAPATTEPPATTEEPTTVPPAPPPTAEIEQIIRDVWPDDLEEQALRVAWRESGYDPRAQNFCCSGLFQIYYDVHASWLAEFGINSAADLYDPHANATAAYALYQRSGGWEPWRMTSD
jgi:LysM repeat protein